MGSPRYERRAGVLYTFAGDLVGVLYTLAAGRGCVVVYTLAVLRACAGVLAGFVAAARRSRRLGRLRPERDRVLVMFAT